MRVIVVGLNMGEALRQPWPGLRVHRLPPEADTRAAARRASDSLVRVVVCSALPGEVVLPLVSREEVLGSPLAWELVRVCHWHGLRAGVVGWEEEAAAGGVVVCSVCGRGAPCDRHAPLVAWRRPPLVADSVLGVLAMARALEEGVSRGAVGLEGGAGYSGW